MSDEWNWGQEPEKTDGSSQQPENTDESGSAASDQTAAPEDELNENVTYHYKYTSSRNSDGAGSTDNGNYYASSNNSDTSGNSSKDSGFESQSSEPRYAHYQVDEQEKKPEEKKKGRHHRLHNDKAASSGFGRKAGNTITLAVIFTISGQEICLVLYEQGVLDKNDDDYENLASGAMGAYDFMINKIYTLEIEPAQLALMPCSASAVVVDVKTGDVVALVSYPGYDNNRLTNDMDTDYYAKLALDQSSPFFNKATQQTTAPGSTLKLLSTIAGMEEGIIDEGTYIECTGTFDYVDPPINCWYKNGHGSLDIRTAIEQSCNYFFNMIGFQLGKVGDNEFSEVQSLNKLQEYASLIGLDRKTGIELSEATPKVSDAKAVPSYMGQGNNLFTTSELARYATVMATSGNVFKLTLLDKVMDPKGDVIQEYEPEIEDVVNISSNIWDVIHDGMRRVIQTHSQFDGLGVEVAGKTGTAELDLRHPNHGLFVGYAPASDPEYAVAIRIANGYSSGNACLIANDIFKYMYNLADKDSILTGIASTDTSDTSND